MMMVMLMNDSDGDCQVRQENLDSEAHPNDLTRSDFYNLSDRMSDWMSDRMSDLMSDRMSDRMSDQM